MTITISKHTLLVLSAGFACCILILLLFAAKGDFTTLAATPQTLSYHGNLTDTNGVPIQGVKTMTFRLYNAPQGGVPKWEQTLPVTFVDGTFQVLLGENLNNPLPLPFDRQCWLGVTVDGGSELAPRQPLAAAPYSLHTLSIADGAITSQKIASGQVVKSLNGLTDEVTLAAGSNLTITPGGNTLTLAATTQIPRGVIVMWSGAVTNVPTGWALCDGSRETPNLRDKFIVGAGGSLPATGGSSTHHHGGATAAHVLTIAEIPAHTHQVQIDGHDGTVHGDFNSGTNAGRPSPIFQPTTSSTGGGQGHSHNLSSDNHLPPYYAHAFIMKL